jgi:RNA polymerase sigma-70 factor (ECF subfamily)
MAERTTDRRASPEVVRALLASRERFLRFLLPRVGSRESAEDVLQAAYVKALERGGGIRKGESAVAWFFRLLRNAVLDHHRRRDVEVRAATSKAKASPMAGEDSELERAVCQCVKDVMPTLKGEYADILRRVEMEGAAVTDVAKSDKITANNAMVRLHRARKALHGRLVETCGTCTQHGCLDCHCKG